MVVPLGHGKENCVNEFFEAVRLKIRVKLLSDLREFRMLKFMIFLRIKLYTNLDDGTFDYAEPKLYPSHFFVLIDPNELDDLMDDSFNEIKGVLDKWINNGSNCNVDCVVSMDIVVWRYQPFSVSSYIELPKYISAKTKMIIV